MTAKPEIAAIESTHPKVYGDLMELADQDQRLASLALLIIPLLMRAAHRSDVAKIAEEENFDLLGVAKALSPSLPIAAYVADELSRRQSEQQARN